VDCAHWPEGNGAPGYLEIKEYFSADIKIKQGDTIRWVFETSHSITFLPAGMQLPNPAPPASRPSDVYDPALVYTSAVPARQPGGPNPTWELKFSTAGTFPYICQLHYAWLGHVGNVIVE
jgi:plastocyanin